MSVQRNALGVIATNGFTLFISVANSVLLTRTLGVTGRGEFAVFSASCGLLSLLLGLGFDTSLRYFIARDRVSFPQILPTLVAWAATVGLLVFGVARLNDGLLGNEIFLPSALQDPGVEAILAVTVASTLFSAGLSSAFAGRRSFRALNLINVASSVIALATYAGLFLAKTGNTFAVDTRTVFMGYLGVQLAGAAVMTVVAQRRLGVGFSLRFLDRGLLREMLRYAGITFAAMVAQFLNYRVDVWIVQHFVGFDGLGLYSVAANVAMMLWVLPRSLSTVLLPSVAAGDPDAGGADVARMSRIALVVSAGVALVLGVSTGVWLPLLYGAEFLGARWAFVVLLVGCVPFSVCVVQASALGGMDRQGINLAAALLGLAATILLDVLLIPSFGIVGAAAASSVSYILTTAVVVRSYSKVAGIPVGDSLLPGLSDIRYLVHGFKSVLR